MQLLHKKEDYSNEDDKNYVNSVEKAKRRTPETLKAVQRETGVWPICQLSLVAVMLQARRDHFIAHMVDRRKTKSYMSQITDLTGLLL